MELILVYYYKLKKQSNLSSDSLFETIVARFKEYNPNGDIEILEKAYEIAEKAHANQLRASGDSYISHPLSVAYILTDLKADAPTLATAILHDVIEDTEVTAYDLLQVFPKEIIEMIQGVTKLSKLRLQSKEEEQAENFRKFLLALSKDIRILLVKLADRLHNMRTIKHIPDTSKQKRISQETIDIYVPLAERIGLFQIKDEMEDICFLVLEEKTRDSIATRVAYLKETFGVEIQKNSAQLHNIIAENGIDANIIGRVKRPYSIWRKMQKRHISFQHLADIFAYRIIVDTTEECYKVLGILHSSYRFINGRFKDYISTPKQNGYQSIHTAIIGPNSVRIEVQIRTRRMNQFAENGVAAHWAYKQNINNPENMVNQFLWLKNLLSVASSSTNAEEFYEHSKLDMYTDVVFVFTPKGKLIELPHGASAIDFAYTIHSTVGHTAVSAVVNDFDVPLSYILNSGDQVEINTKEGSTPSVEWLDFAVTGSARSAIKKFVRQQREKDLVSVGFLSLKSILAQRGHILNDDIVNVFLVKLKIDKAEILYSDIATNKIKISQLYYIIARYLKVKPYKRLLIMAKNLFKKADSFLVLDENIDTGAIIRAVCCTPVPGDKIVGALLKNGKIEAHRLSCKCLAEIKGARIQIDWNLLTAKEYETKLKVVVRNRAGIASNILHIFAKHNINLLSITTMTSEFPNSNIIFSVLIKNLVNLENALKEVKTMPVVVTVERYIDKEAYESKSNNKPS